MDRLAGRLVERLRGDPEEPAVVGLEGEDADQIFDALGSETSRAVLATCYEEGQTRSELADHLETSIQNVGYHVDKLESAGLLDAVETRYGANGREVRVYEPTKRAVLVAAGEPGTKARLESVVNRLFTPVIILGLVTLVAGVIARGPARLGLLDDDAVAATETGSWLLPAVIVFVVGVVVIVAADRAGVWASSTRRRTGRQATLLGRNHMLTRRYVGFGVGLGLATFLLVDLVLISSSQILTLGAGLLIGGIVLTTIVTAVVQADRNGGLLVSWMLPSTPVCGVWLYLSAGELVVSGVSLGMVVIVFALLVGFSMPVGTVCFLLGNWLHRRRTDENHLAARTTLALACYPLGVAVVVGGWLLSGTYL